MSTYQDYSALLYLTEMDKEAGEKWDKVKAFAKKVGKKVEPVAKNVGMGALAGAGLLGATSALSSSLPGTGISNVFGHRIAGKVLEERGHPEQAKADFAAADAYEKKSDKIKQESKETTGRHARAGAGAGATAGLIATPFLNRKERRKQKALERKEKKAEISALEFIGA